MRVWQVLSIVLVTSMDGATSIYEGLRGHQVWSVNGDTDGLVSQLRLRGMVDVLHHSGPTQKLRVSPEFASDVLANFQDAGLEYHAVIGDLAAFLQEEENRDRSVRRESEDSCTAHRCSAPLHAQYMTFEQMEWYLKQVNETSPSKISVSSIGRSVLGRDLWLAHLKATNSTGRSVWIEAGIHAREWISSAVALHIIHKLLYDDSVMADVDVYVVPMANPDGYVYTWTNDRLWRKNRRPVANSSCDGVDLNRNWDDHFGVGASSHACSEIYDGLFAFSEPETQALRDAMQKEKDNLILVLSLHSFGQTLLYPWGWSATKEAPGTLQLIAVGKIFVEAIRAATGRHYSVKNSARDLYVASGTTDDWAMAVLGTKYVYTVELRDQGFTGFLLPAAEIVPCSVEVWHGLQEVIKHIIKEETTSL
ncbi:carboxypeptidase B-like [Panulirus ornatus]|uniref:carboxypeptidase B-like n=1 Tax=Panulirus ornatus TaxID=150431 RepID=UPI003A8783E0